MGEQTGLWPVASDGVLINDLICDICTGERREGGLLSIIRVAIQGVP